MMKSLTVGLWSQEEIRERALKIARGEYKPKANEPKIWFASMKSIAEVLSDENRALLRLIRETQPESVSALAELVGGKPSKLSRNLKIMSYYGIVEMRRDKNRVRPIAKATVFRIIAK